MSNSKVIRFIGFLCVCILLFALYLQHSKGISLCPLCVVQRYAFCAILIGCLIARLSFLYRIGTFIAFLSSIGGLLAAGYQVLTAKNAQFQCSSPVIVDWIVNSPLTHWLPFLFRPTGNCSDALHRIFGLTIPMWALIWFALFALVLFFMTIRRRI